MEGRFVDVTRSDVNNLYRFASFGGMRKTAEDPPAQQGGGDPNPYANPLYGALIGAALGVGNSLITPKDRDESRVGRLLRHLLGGATLGGIAGFGWDATKGLRETLPSLGSLVTGKTDEELARERNQSDRPASEAIEKGVNWAINKGTEAAAAAKNNLRLGDNAEATGQEVSVPMPPKVTVTKSPDGSGIPKVEMTPSDPKTVVLPAGFGGPLGNTLEGATLGGTAGLTIAKAQRAVNRHRQRAGEHDYFQPVVIGGNDLNIRPPVGSNAPVPPFRTITQNRGGSTTVTALTHEQALANVAAQAKRLRSMDPYSRTRALETMGILDPGTTARLYPGGAGAALTKAQQRAARTADKENLKGIGRAVKTHAAKTKNEGSVNSFKYRHSPAARHVSKWAALEGLLLGALIGAPFDVHNYYEGKKLREANTQHYGK